VTGSGARPEEVAHICRQEAASLRCDSCPGRWLGLCASLDNDALGSLAAMGGQRRWDKRQVLYHADDPAQAFYKVTSGVVAEFTDLADGRRQIVAIHTVGDICGYATRNGRHVFAAQAISPVQACVFGTGKFSALMGGNLGFACAMADDVSERLNQAMIGRTVVGQLRSFERVAHFILEMEERMRPGPTAGEVELHLTRREIADYLGLTEETVSRAFTRLKQLQLISLRGANVVVLRDRKRLAEVAWARSQNRGPVRRHRPAGHQEKQWKSL
jgi:CRP/FNR family transcriptional regulator